jgi:hypothetical protein
MSQIHRTIQDLWYHTGEVNVYIGATNSVTRMMDTSVVPWIVAKTISSSDSAFLNRLQPELYDFGITDNHKWFMDEIIGHWWKGKKIEYEVWCSLGDTTWETQANCNQLAALDT